MPYQRLIIAPEVATMFSRQDRPAERVLAHLGDSSVTLAEPEAARRANVSQELRRMVVIDQDGDARYGFLW